MPILIGVKFRVKIEVSQAEFRIRIVIDAVVPGYTSSCSLGIQGLLEEGWLLLRGPFGSFLVLFRLVRRSIGDLLGARSPEPKFLDGVQALLQDALNIVVREVDLIDSQ